MIVAVSYRLIHVSVTSPNRQAAMDITAKFCQKEMEEYGACVASNPSTWQEQCHHLKVKVAQCTSSQYVCTREPFLVHEHLLD